MARLQFLGGNHVVGVAGLRDEDKQRTEQMRAAQAKRLAGANDDEKYAGQRTGDAGDRRPGEAIQAIQPVEQCDAGGHQTVDERGIAGGRSLQAGDQKNLIKTKTEGGDA